MTTLDWIEIENFKGFGNPVRIPLAHPCVLIGPNNSGKTTVLQALSLWGVALREWSLKRRDGDLGPDGSAVVNRLSLLDVPVGNTRLLWHDADPGGGEASEPIVLTLGLILNSGRSAELRLEILPHSAEGIRCRPADGCRADAELLKEASELRFGLLHPMSGIASAVSTTTDEPLVAPGRVNVLLGQGQTAQALRNVCYQLWENSPEDWTRVAARMAQIFGCTFDVPTFDGGRGSLFLNYRQPGVAHPLEIVLAGRGMQQMLLLLAYLYGHRRSVVLFDEPDAHLEILRQRQAFALLRDVADETETQIVLATHSEVILDESVETNLVSIVNGAVSCLSQRKDIRVTLRNLGVFHFYAAEQKRRLLIVEGTTDVSMLRAFAVKLGHPAAAILDDAPFVFYTQDICPDTTPEMRLKRLETEGVDYRRYVSTLQRLVPDLRAVAVFDSDGKDVRSELDDEVLKVFRWTRYEIENYFITPRVLKKFLLAHGVDDIIADEAVDMALVDLVFSGKREALNEFNSLSDALQVQMLSHTKMSLFAESVFRDVARRTGCPELLKKASFYRLISDGIEDVPAEVVSCLDLIQKELAGPVIADKGVLSANCRTCGPVKQEKGPVNGICGPVKCPSSPVNSVSGPVNDEVGPVKLLDIIVRNPGLRKNKLAVLTGLSERKIKRYLEEVLVGRTEFRGAPKTGGYYAL